MARLSQPRGHFSITEERARHRHMRAHRFRVRELLREPGLLDRCLRVVGPDGRAVDGPSAVGDEERSWRLTPDHPWVAGDHQLVVDPVLEDLAGNSVRRVFDRDLTRAEDEPEESGPVTITFRPRPSPG